MKTLLSRIIVFVRRREIAKRLKHVVPQPFRTLAWRLAKTQSTLQVLGSKLCIPPNSVNRDILVDEYEPAVSARISLILQAGMTFCDVGANFGIFTLLGARLVGAQGKVFAFEPVPENYDVLCKNIALNGYSNIQASRLAVSDITGSSQIFLSSSSGSHSMVGNLESATGVVLPVQTIRLDEVPDLTSIDLLKIDTEGTELAVLRGLGVLRPSHVILECNIERLRAGGLSGAQFLQALRNLGFHQIENLDDPERGLQKIELSEEGSWNLHLQRSAG